MRAFFWQLGDLALSSCNLQLAQDCAKYSDDLAGQLVIFSSLGQSENIASLGDEARQKGRFNVAFLVGVQTGPIISIPPYQRRSIHPCMHQPIHPSIHPSTHPLFYSVAPFLSLGNCVLGTFGMHGEGHHGHRL